MTVESLYITGAYALFLGFPMINMFIHNMLFSSKRKKPIRMISGPDSLIDTKARNSLIAILIAAMILSALTSYLFVDKFKTFDVPCQIIGALFIVMSANNLFKGRLYMARGRMQDISTLARRDDPDKFMAEVIYKAMTGFSFLAFGTFIQAREVLS